MRRSRSLCSSYCVRVHFVVPHIVLSNVLLLLLLLLLVVLRINQVKSCVTKKALRTVRVASAKHGTLEFSLRIQTPSEFNCVHLRELNVYIAPKLKLVWCKFDYTYIELWTQSLSSVWPFCGGNCVELVSDIFDSNRTRILKGQYSGPVQFVSHRLARASLRRKLACLCRPVPAHEGFPLLAYIIQYQLNRILSILQKL